MSKQDDIEFLNSRLRILQENYETLQNLLPCDLLPDDDPPRTSEDDERCAQLADKHGFDGSLFRNLFPLHPDRDGLDYESLIKRYRKKIETISRIVAAIEAEDTISLNLTKALGSPPTTLQQNIWKALDGRAMKANDLAEKASCGKDRGRLYATNRKSKTGGLTELMKRGLVINKRGIGYYRPDSPPTSN